MAACKFTLIARSFSSSAAQNQLIKTPIPVFGVGGRYAAALYSAGVKAKEIEKVESELNQFHKVFTSQKKFSQILRDPTIKKNVKAQTLKEAAQKMSFTKTATNVLSLIAENGRLKDFNAIMNSFKLVMAAHRGEVLCEVTSAKPLAEAEKKDIETALKKLAGSKTILLTTKVDPKIIGGLMVSIGDKFVDMSISSKIKKYSDIIKSVA